MNLKFCATHTWYDDNAENLERILSVLMLHSWYGRSAGRAVSLSSRPGPDQTRTDEASARRDRQNVTSFTFSLSVSVQSVACWWSWRADLFATSCLARRVTCGVCVVNVCDQVDPGCRREWIRTPSARIMPPWGGRQPREDRVRGNEWRDARGPGGGAVRGADRGAVIATGGCRWAPVYATDLPVYRHQRLVPFQRTTGTFLICFYFHLRF